MVLHQGQEAVVQQSSRLIHAPVHLDTQGLILKNHGVKGEVDPPVVHSVAALQRPSREGGAQGGLQPGGAGWQGGKDGRTGRRDVDAWRTRTRPVQWLSVTEHRRRQRITLGRQQTQASRTWMTK